MDSSKKIDLITRNLEEILTLEDLNHLIEIGMPLKHYIGFEISGRIHLGSGIMTGLKVSDFQKAGMDCSVYLASWHAWINNKLGGDLERIRKVAVGYFKEGMSISYECTGADPEKIKFVTGDELYHNNDDYWLTVIEVCKQLTVARAQRATTIMGRKQGQEMKLADLIYAPMQVADIFIQDLNIAHAGIDQRKAQVIAREVALKLKVKPLKFKDKIIKPIALHNPLISGLQKPPVWPIPKEELQSILSEMKMSKSIPNSCIFIEDSPDEIKAKINKAFCLEKEIEYNPILNWCRHLIFTDEKSKLEIERPEKFGGNIAFNSFDELEKSFAEGKLHPMDLKNGLSDYLIDFLEPVRKHFAKPGIQKMKQELIQA